MNNFLGFLWACLFAMAVGAGCSSDQANQTGSNTENNRKAHYYTVEDFARVPKIDVHVHLTTTGTTVIDLASKNGFKLFGIVVDVPDFPPINRQVKVNAALHNNYPEVLAFGTAFSMTGWDEPDWAEKTISQLRQDFEKGARAVKVWKNIGMSARDKDGNLIFLDNPRFDPVFRFIKEQNKVLLIHAGEPRNCWLPLDSMTVKNDRDYFAEHPEYHMYLHPEMPSYEDQIRARDNMLARHPGLKVVAVHMASLEWSVDRAADFLERFPDAYLDLAERISHTQYQSQRDRKKVRDFFIKYQDRILYATDFQQHAFTNPDELKKYMQEVWLNDWRYFNTDEMITVPQLDDPVQGLALPGPVVDKIYRLNALKVFEGAWPD